MNRIDYSLPHILYAVSRPQSAVVRRTASSIPKYKQGPQNSAERIGKHRPSFLSGLRWFHTIRNTTNVKSRRVMSYRPNYQDSWRPPAQQRDSWRPSAERLTSEPDRRWAGTRVRYDEEYQPFSESQKFSFRGDSWRPYQHEIDTLTAREEVHDQVNEDWSSQRLFGRPPRTRRRKANPTRPDVVVPVKSNLNPTSPTFQPGNLGQDSSFNDGVPASLRSVQNYARYPVYRVDKYYRSARSPNAVAGRNGGNCLDAISQEAGPSTRYPLRSRQTDASSARVIMNDVAHLGEADFQHGLSSQQTSYESARTLSTKPIQYERNERRPRQVAQPPAPKATDLYLAQARLPVIRSTEPRKLLVVLDLNGTLLVRPNRMQPRIFNIRPGVHQLLEYLFSNHVMMVYSSAQPDNVVAMVDALVTKKRAKSLAAIWGRDKLDLTPTQYHEKVQVYKKLDKVWGDEHIQATCPWAQQRWSQANTVLVDDSHLKAKSQPHNLIQVPEFTKKQKLTQVEKKREHEVVASLVAKLEELKWTHDVSRLILRWQTGEIEPPRATKLSFLPKSAAEGGEEQQEQQLSGDLPAGTETASEDAEEVEVVEVLDRDGQADLERDMESLSTDRSPAREGEDDSNGVSIVDQPAVSAAEWREFLK